MTRRVVALDSNLAVLLVVGQVSKALVGRHKRLRSFSPADFDRLLGFIREAGVLVTTPNALTEVSNLAHFGLHEPLRSEVMRSLAAVIASMRETYVASNHIVTFDEFLRLGLTDTAWLACLGPTDLLLTADLDLHLAARSRGLNTINFNHWRDLD